MTANRVYAMSAITALTAQNTTGVTDIMEVSPKFLAEQLDGIFTDIYPDAVKTGMVASGELIQVIADKLTEYKAGNIVVDPVMVATSGDKLIDDIARKHLKEEILPLATIITPNIPEAEEIVNFKILTEDDVNRAGKFIIDEVGCKSVVIKGGHLTGEAKDYLFLNDGTNKVWTSERFKTNHTHGTG
ncbi:MAG: bifunctional hydroxymethylpyrimidine kinase/phosphomethylpyrimidine kinase, partial [Eubacterium sp.]|nr:bifunctional hydroxymethylpyrimidine kinase/phosphomethylpyrimidine kinase [Eubacterium sp.]